MKDVTQKIWDISLEGGGLTYFILSLEYRGGQTVAREPHAALLEVSAAREKF